METNGSPAAVSGGQFYFGIVNEQADLILIEKLREDIS
jgi:hypothetical protein